MKRIFFTLTLICCLLNVRADEADFQKRAHDLHGYYIENGSTKWLYGVFRQLSAYAEGLPMVDKDFDDIFATIKSNHDCNDFTLNGLLRMMYLDKEKSRIPATVKSRAKERILDFKYWWDDGRRDTTYRCYHTENHQALYHTAELLAGQMFKKEKFTNGMTGQQHIKHATERLIPWLDYRFRFGFSEWLSTYYDVEALLLTNLYDFAEDKEIKRKAGNVLNILLFDIALNQRNGYLCGSSGRTYPGSLLSGVHTTSPLSYVALGTGNYHGGEITGAVAMATSTYRCPDVIAAIATDSTLSYVSRQRTSINVEDAPSYGLSYDNELNCHLFWGMQEFIHPLSIKMSKQISEKYDTWPYRNYDHYIELYRKEQQQTGSAVSRDRFALSEANIVTMRTPDFLLSTALDYRKGRQGYQQHPWIATLTPKAVVFTNHPGGTDLKNSPTYWSGNEILPRAAQHRNVALSIYRLPENKRIQYTHAYFPAGEMDEICQSDNWIFARKGNGYLALYSSTTPTLKKDIRGELCDLVADTTANVWLCEMGRTGEWPSFAAFVNAIKSASIVCDGTDITYTSPSAGKITFGWDAPLTVDGQPVPMRHNFRYDNPFCKAAADTRSIEIAYKDKKLTMYL